MLHLISSWCYHAKVPGWQLNGMMYVSALVQCLVDDENFAHAKYPAMMLAIDHVHITHEVSNGHPTKWLFLKT